MTDQDILEKQLAELRKEHRELDETIQTLAADSPHDPIELQRLKKRKLHLKDEIARLDSAMLPDIIASYRIFAKILATRSWPGVCCRTWPCRHSPAP